MLHSTVAWMVRCRSGTSRAEVTRSGRHPVQPREHRGRGEGADAGRRELDGERHALERPADAGDIRGVLGGHVEPGIRRPRAVAEESHGRRLQDRVDRRLDGVGRHRERVDVEDLLAAHAEPRATRHEERRAGQVGQQRHDVGRRVEHLLEVVEHDEVATAGPRDAQLLGERPVAGVAHAELACDRREHVVGVAHVLERDERHPVERPAGVARDLDREAALADAAGADERDEPLRVVAEPGEQRGDLELAPHRLVVAGRDAAGRCRGLADAVSARHRCRRRCRPPGAARDASNRSASRVARSAEISSASSSAVENGVYDTVSSSRIRAMSSPSRVLAFGRAASRR